LERDRFDYARVLISTPSLEVINVSAHLLVDDSVVEIKMIEECSFNLREDACLEEDVQEVVSDHGVEHEEEHDHQVEVLVEKLAVEVAQNEKEFDVVPVSSLADGEAHARAGEPLVARSSPREIITVRNSFVREDGDTHQSVEGGSQPVRRSRHTSCPAGESELLPLDRGA
jgi:hypothetical protein